MGMTQAFAPGDVVEVVNWSGEPWLNADYEVIRKETGPNEYYLIRRLGTPKGQADEGRFTAEHLKYVGPKTYSLINIGRLSVAELAELISAAANRMVELTKDA